MCAEEPRPVSDQEAHLHQTGISQPVATAPVSANASPSSTQWYGYQLMLADATAIAIYAASAPRRADAVSWLGATSFFFAPAVVHAMNRRPWLAVASPLMRLGIPTALGLLWYAANPCQPNQMFCGLDAVVIGGGLGLAAAMVIDYVWARKPTSLAPATAVAPSAPRRRAPVELRAAAIAPAQGGGATLVLGGTF
jgi:hypothetical protein